VYTSAHNDSQLLAEFKLNEDQEKRIRRAFIKRDNQPKILIVTEKLLTGFDAPILYCMYLDKPMRDRRGIARSSGPRRGRARAESAPVHRRPPGTTSRRYGGGHEVRFQARRLLMRTLEEADR
jgi:type I restriction enzyme, R subunit